MDEEKFKIWSKRMDLITNIWLCVFGLVCILAWLGLVYVAVHFIFKFW